MKRSAPKPCGAGFQSGNAPASKAGEAGRYSSRPSPAAIAESGGGAAAGAAELLARWGDEPREGVAAVYRLHGHEGTGASAAEHLSEAIANRAHRREGEHLASVLRQPEADGRARHRRAGHQVDHVAELG